MRRFILGLVALISVMAAPVQASAQVTIEWYNHTRKLLWNGEVDIDALKVMLVNSHTFDATDDDVSDDIAADEVDGFGWDTGGEPLSGEAVTVANTDEAKYDANDVQVTATGGPIGPATGAVILDGTSDKPLWYIDFDGAKTADEGTDFLITWPAAGIATDAPPS